MFTLNLRKATAAIGAAGALAIAGVITVSAHANTVALHSVCSTDGLNKIITATITNDFDLTERATNTAQTGAQFTPPYVDIAKSPNADKTGAMTASVLGTQTGDVSLTVHGVWSDEVEETTVGHTDLGGVCTVATASPTPTPTSTPRPTATPRATPSATPTPTPTGAVSAVSTTKSTTSSSAALPITGVPNTGAGQLVPLAALMALAGTVLLVAVTRRRGEHSQR